MTFKELADEINQLTLQEKRVQKDDYLEVVVPSSVMTSLDSLLESRMGSPMKPLNRKPSPEAARFAEPYGGIFEGQVLYHKRQDNADLIAMLWPWGSGDAVTVKVIHQSC